MCDQCVVEQTKAMNDVWNKFDVWFESFRNRLGRHFIHTGFWIAGAKNGNLYKYAKEEIEEFYENNANAVNDEMEQTLNNHVLEMIAMDSMGHHSGFSHPFMLSRYEQLAGFKPINPISFDDKYWVHVYDDDRGPIYQHKKMSNLFKDSDSIHNTDGFVFEEWFENEECDEGGFWCGFTTRGSARVVETPEEAARGKVYVKVERLPEGEEHPVFCSDFRIIDDAQYKLVLDSWNKLYERRT